jgi:hypothetical protein
MPASHYNEGQAAGRFVANVDAEMISIFKPGIGKTVSGKARL